MRRVVITGMGVISPLGDTLEGLYRSALAGRSAWWDWNPVQHALHYLWMTGTLTVESRRHFHKRYDLPSFPDAIAFVVAVGFEAESRNHHPDIDVRWRTVHLRLTTHDAGGLTAFDFDLATAIDARPGATG